MAPISWHQNEINYFDLASRLVAPERFSPHSAVFDDSYARAVSLGFIGVLIELVGADAALVISRIAMAACFALAFTALAAAWSLSGGEVLGGIAVFLLAGQSYVAGEWIFGGVGPKVFAYAAVVAAIACVSTGKARAAVLWAALATYCHFLVGGFWAAAVLLLAVLQGMPVRSAVRHGLLYTVLVLPLFMVLSYEQFLTPLPNVADLDLTVNEIYSVVRNPHHVAPFLSLNTFLSWLPGITALFAATSVLRVVVMSPAGPISRPLAVWILLLHLYLIVVFVFVFLDRNTHILGPFYVFRPNALAMLLFLILMGQWLRLSLGEHARHWVAAIAVAAALIYAGPRLPQIGIFALQSGTIPAGFSFDDEEVPELVDWLRQNTDPEDVVVLESTRQTDWNTSWIAFERIIGRPTLVSFKFVPTSKRDLVRWYRLMTWREAVFEGDCGAIPQQPATYLVTVQASTRERLADCGTILWARGSYGVIGLFR